MKILKLSEHPTLLMQPLVDAVMALKRNGYEGVINDIHGLQPYIEYTIEDLEDFKNDIWTDLQIAYILPSNIIDQCLKN